LHNIRKAPFNGHKGEISGVAFGPNGLEATTSAFSHQFLNRDAIVWSIPDGGVVRVLHGHEVGVFSVACSPDGNRTATGGGGVLKWSTWIYDNAIRIWNKKGELCGKFGDDLFFVRALAFSPDSRSLLSGSSNHPQKTNPGDGSSLRLWDVETCTEMRRFELHTSAVHSVAFSPDGKRVAAGSTGMKAAGLSPGGTSMTVKVYSEAEIIPVGQETMTKEQLLGCLDSDPFKPFAVSLHAAAITMKPTQRIFVSFTARPRTSDPEDCTLRVWDVN
jgi:WD40 repeat protein